MVLSRSSLIAVVSSALLARVASSQARVQSTVSALPAVAAAFANTISISVGSGAIQSLAGVIDNAPNNFPTPVSLTLTWDLHPSTGSVRVIGYFTNPTAAMSSGPISVPASWLAGRVLTVDVPGAPTTFTAFTQNAVGGVGASGGSLQLLNLPILGNNRTGTRTFDVQLQLDLTGRVLTPGSYTGTLNIRAVTQ
jgi:hypothetical protein